MAASSDSDEDAVNPTEKLLIDKYEKYPEYLQLTFKKPDTFFENLEPFYGANKESFFKILSQKSKDAVTNYAFPLKLNI